METPASPPRPWSRRAEAAAVACFWLVLGVLSVVREAFRPWREDPLGAAEAFGAMAEYGLWALATPAVVWLVGRYPVGRGAWAGRLAGQVVVAAAVALTVEAVTRGLLRPALSGPPRPGREWSLGGAVGGLWFLDELVIALALVAAGYARAALVQVHDSQVEAERHVAERARLEAQLAEARLSALRMQLHPHFLFNTLNAVSALVERDPAGVRTLVARLSSLLRRVLDAPPDLIPLRDEAAFLRDYLDVQRVRFQGRLDVEEAWAPGTLGALVPPLVLQPLVENAVGHGVGRIEDGVGTIRVGSRRDGDRLVLTVEDDGPGLGGADLTGADVGGAGSGGTGPGGVGLPNTRARLDALFGADGRLDLAARSGGGVIARVVVPFRLAAGGDGQAALAPPVPTGRG
ncbi:histidine kinase [Rubrivirga sp. S365]|uniref:Histidine kinase n=1 Tax=Rubrivirga litoralis TaxID=3075598 RepID=A0ABU3BPD9_9BACT|nr:MULTISPECIES: histidine kinase [unclassified Rubrivirga]MDT0631156.1 histidine kinase [Rubrivirga sp. F394]MDT7856701.1 histidine kinase [Rubrivirga sp. S365]